MNKLKLGVVFGGMSTENEVSVISAKSILNNLNKEKYEIYPIYIDKQGIWYKYNQQEQNQQIENITKYLKNLDVIFPVLHGLYGEDGTIQGLFELLKIPYVGCKVLSSSIGMDKIYTKAILEKACINQTAHVYLKKLDNNYIYVNEKFEEKNVNLGEAINIITEKIKYPMFIKPSNSGSSVGVNKATNIGQLKNAIEEAGKFDKKIIIEQGIEGKEVECAVLGNDTVIASCVGEIKSAGEFYSYDSKYKNQKSKTLIPADITDDQSNEIRKLAIKAFKSIDGSGLSRVDFFVENNTGKIYLNEINTMPGFTDISMYPKLFEASGISYSELLDKLISFAL